MNDRIIEAVTLAYNKGVETAADLVEEAFAKEFVPKHWGGPIVEAIRALRQPADEAAFFARGPAPKEEGRDG